MSFFTLIFTFEIGILLTFFFLSVPTGRPPVGGMHRSVSLDGPVPLISADNHTGGEAPLHHYNMYPSTKQYVSYAPTIGGDNNVMKGTMMTGTTPLVNLADRAGCNTRVYHVRKGHLYDAKHDVSSMSLIYNPATTSQGTQNLHAGTTLTNESAAPCSNIYGRFTGGLLGGITESSGISPTPDASKTAKQPKRKRSAVGKKNKANATQPQMQPSPKKVARRSKSTKVSVRANVGHAKLAAPKKSLLQKKSKKQTPAAKTLPHKTTGGKAPITSATDRCLSTPTFPYSLQPTPEGTNFNPPTLSGEASSPFQLAPYSGAYGMVPPADTPHVDVLRSTSTSSPRNILPQIHSPMHVELVHGASRGNTADSLLYASTAATSLASTVSKYTVDVASSQMDSANTMTGVMRPEHTATFSFVNTLPLPPHRVHEAATARSPWVRVVSTLTVCHVPRVTCQHIHMSDRFCSQGRCTWRFNRNMTLWAKPIVRACYLSGPLCSNCRSEMFPLNISHWNHRKKNCWQMQRRMLKAQSPT